MMRMESSLTGQPSRLPRFLVRISCLVALFVVTMPLAVAEHPREKTYMTRNWGVEVVFVRQTSNMPQADRTYWMFFANPGQYVKPGDKVTIEIGDFVAKNIVVQ